MFRSPKAMIGLLSLSMACTSGHAATILTANITNAAENPVPTLTTSTGAPRPASFGTATFVLNDAMTAMTMSVTVSNLDFTGSQTPDSNDNLVAAHIHASPTASLTVNAPVVWGFFGSPFNDDNPNDRVVTPFSSGVGGTITGKWDAPEGNNTILADQLANILSGHSYINFHTVQFGGGETRGFLQAVPEPSAVLLLSVGFVSLLGIGMQGRRKTGRQ